MVATELQPECPHWAIDSRVGRTRVEIKVCKECATSPDARAREMAEALAFLQRTQFNETYDETTCHYCELLWNPEWDAALSRKDGSERLLAAKIHAPDCELGKFVATLRKRFP